MVSVLAFSVDDPSSNPGRSLKSLLFVYLDVDVVNICYLNIERTKVNKKRGRCWPFRNNYYLSVLHFFQFHYRPFFR